MQDSLLGGSLMFLAGLLYLLAEDYVLADFSRENVEDAHDHTGDRATRRILTGVQVCVAGHSDLPPGILHSGTLTRAFAPLGRPHFSINACHSFQLLIPSS